MPGRSKLYRVQGEGGERAFLHYGIALAAVLGTLTGTLQAEVATDGTVGLRTQLGGPDYVIPEGLGTRTGANLFHSFQTFNVDRSESATFTGSTGIDNVVSRVTGGSESRINGLLRSQVPNADFYFVNPSGVVFGENAKVDVPAAFHVSTSDELRFADGARYSATDPASSTLTMAKPEAFGFLGNRSASIQITGSNLQFTSSQAVSVSAGGIQVSGAGLTSTAGEIRLVTSSSAGSVSVQVDGSQRPVAGTGELSIVNSSLRAEGDGAGRVEVRTGSLTMSGSTLEAENLGATDATEQQGVYMAAEQVSITNSVIEANASGAGQGARVAVLGKGISLDNRGQVLSNARSTGAAGAVLVDGTTVTLTGGSQGQSIVSSDALGGSGDAGNVLVNASESLRIADGARISSDTRSEGKGGRVEVNAANLTVSNPNSDAGFTGISADALGGSEGDAGVVAVTVTGALAMSGTSRISSDADGAGSGGGIAVQTGTLKLEGPADQNAIGAGITSNSSSSTGNAGNIVITASGKVELISGGFINTDSTAGTDAGIIAVEGASVTLDGRGNTETRIGSSVRGEAGRAGGIQVITPGALNLSGGASIATNNAGSGESLGVIIEAGSVQILGDNQNNTQLISGASGSGAAGVVSVTSTGLVELKGSGSRIVTDNRGVGEAGKIQVIADRINVEGDDTGTLDTSITSDALTGSTGNAGQISVMADSDVRVANGAFVTSDTSGAGNAGDIAVQAPRVVVDGQGQNTFISSNTLGEATGDAGQVFVIAPESLEVYQRGRIGSDISGGGNGGNVGVVAGNLILDGRGGSADISSNARTGSTGNAGEVSVVAENISILDGGLISSDSFDAGRSGSVLVFADTLFIDQGDSTSFTGISSDTLAQSGGDAGRVEVTASELITVRNGGFISSDTHGIGQAGDVSVVTQDMVIDGEGFVTGIRTEAKENSTGAAGTVDVTAQGQVFISQAGTISSDTKGTGAGGSVHVRAQNLVVNGAGTVTPISTAALTGSTGDAGRVQVDVSGLLSLSDGGRIANDTFGVGNAGGVVVNAGQLDISGSGGTAGITSSAVAGSEGNAGSIEITVSGHMGIGAGGKISSGTEGLGNAGIIGILAGSADIVGGENGEAASISTIAQNSPGNAGGIVLAVTDRLGVARGGSISSDTLNAGTGGLVLVRANDIVLDGQQLLTSISSDTLGNADNAGGVLVVADNSLILRDGAYISSDTYGTGTAGAVLVNARDILIDGSSLDAGISTEARQGAIGAAGAVEVTAVGDIFMTGRGRIASDTRGPGASGSVQVKAQNLLADGGGVISTAALAGSTGDAGRIQLDVSELLALTDGGRIANDTFGTGNAGGVRVNMGQLHISGSDAGITTGAVAGSEGNAGNIEVTATGHLGIGAGGKISSGTAGLGNAGTIEIYADSADIVGGESGEAASINTSAQNSPGNAGSITLLVTNRLGVARGGSINSDTNNGGGGGFVQVAANDIVLDGQQFYTEVSSDTVGDAGSAGRVVVVATDSMVIRDGAVVTSTTFGTGDAGAVGIQAPNLLIDGADSLFASVNTLSRDSATGNAGAILLLVPQTLTLRSNGFVNSSTFGTGRAGLVRVEAGRVVMQGAGSDIPLIASIAGETSLGQAGSIEIETGELDMSSGKIFIDSLATVPEEVLPSLQLTDIKINTDHINMSNSTVSAAASGNVPASAVKVTASGIIQLDDSNFSTEANQADGGPIELNADALVLRSSKMTTSVKGQGDGGDIDVNASVLAMSTGFIQANTAGLDASGGDIRVRGDALVPSHRNLITGGDEPVAFQPGVNVIQAAAPDGVSGNIALASPELDISGSLVGLSGELLNLAGLESDPCLAQQEEGSSLTLVGRGALPASAAHSRSGLNRTRLQKLLEQAPPEPPAATPAKTHPKTSARIPRRPASTCARR